MARLIRVLRAVRSIRILYSVGRRDPSVAVLAGMLLSGIVLFIGSCLGVLWAETRLGGDRGRGRDSQPRHRRRGGGGRWSRVRRWATATSPP